MKATASRVFGHKFSPCLLLCSPPTPPPLLPASSNLCLTSLELAPAGKLEHHTQKSCCTLSCALLGQNVIRHQQPVWSGNCCFMPAKPSLYCDSRSVMTVRLSLSVCHPCQPLWMLALYKYDVEMQDMTCHKQGCLHGKRSIFPLTGLANVELDLAAMIASASLRSQQCPLVCWQITLNGVSSEIRGCGRSGSGHLCCRFWPDPQIQTRAVLSLDDDILFSCKDLEHGFSVWRRNPTRLVGFYPRLAEGSPLLYSDGKSMGQPKLPEVRTASEHCWPPQQPAVTSHPNPPQGRLSDECWAFRRRSSAPICQSLYSSVQLSVSLHALLQEFQPVA